MRNLIAAAAIAGIALTLGGVSGANDTKSDQPEVSGTTQGNVGCAVLEKHTPVKGKLLAVGVIYARTEYRVLDTFNCKLPKDKFTGPGDVKDLNRFAVDNRIKLVVIPSHYSDEQLQQARSMCQPANGAQPDHNPSGPPPDKPSSQ
jgi:hypothetical protein